MLRFLLPPLLLAVAAYALYLALLFVQQRSMMFPGVDLPSRAVIVLPENAEQVRIPASFGNVQAVWLRPANAAAAPAALYFHGNYERVEDNLVLLSPLRELGMHVLLVEYPGYAGSDGAPSRASLGEAARRGYDWLAARPEVDPTRIVAIGRSIGSGPASELSLERPLRAIILLSPFTAIRDFAARFAAPPQLIRDPFDNRAALRQFDGPVLLFHGRDDSIIPPGHSRELATVAARARLIELPGGHNDVAYFEADFLDHLNEFLRREGIVAGPP